MDPSVHLAYVGPGAGFAFLGSFIAVAGSLLATAFSFLLWPFRMLFLAARRRGRFGKTEVKKAIFLGLDGFDPGLTEPWMAEGKLPNLSRLREQGSFHRLRTTFAPLSPVAWSTFATGVNPGKHNVFNFLNRDLRTYAPELSSARVRSVTRFVKILRTGECEGGSRFPLRREDTQRNGAARTRKRWVGCLPGRRAPRSNWFSIPNGPPFPSVTRRLTSPILQSSSAPSPPSVLRF